MEATTFVGLDVHKRMTSVAIAEAGRGGEVRFMGEIPSSPEALHRLVERLKGLPAAQLLLLAGPCGYGVHRLRVQPSRSDRLSLPSGKPITRSEEDIRSAFRTASSPRW